METLQGVYLHGLQNRFARAPATQFLPFCLGGDTGRELGGVGDGSSRSSPNLTLDCHQGAIFSRVVLGSGSDEAICCGPFQ
eukprot:805486-Pelagomonas_calceolata.AAC.1